MLTLTLCQSDDYKYYLIQVTSEQGALIDIFTLDGEQGSENRKWTALTAIGEQDDVDPDPDDFWRAVDESIRWLSIYRGEEAGWQACEEAYAEILSPFEMVNHCKELTREAV